MHIASENYSQSFGNQLVDDITLPVNKLNLLFSALLLTATGVFIGGNLLLLDLGTLMRSAQIALPCFGLLLVFYAVSHQTKSVIWGLMSIYGLLWLLVYSRLHAFAPAVFLLFVASGYVALRYLRVERKDRSAVILMAVIATVTILALAFRYTSFDMLPRLHAGNVHQDTLFHASISAMIKNYGVSSTGLHGLVETPYHVFSHALMAGISLISSMGVIEVYGVANSVLIAPILIFSLTAFCGKLDQSRQLPMPMVWAFTCLFLVLLAFLFEPWAIWTSYFVSESYLVSLGLLMLGLALLFKRRLIWIDLVTVLLVAVMIANAKASVGLIFAGLWFVRLIFLRSPRRVWVFAGAMLTALATAWVVFDAAHANAGSMPVEPLHFIRGYSFLGTYLDAAGKAILGGTVPNALTLMLALVAVGSFFLLHFGVSWVVIGRVAYVGGLRGLFSAPLAIYSLAAVIAGAGVASIFAIDGGSAYYFSNVAFFVSLPGLIVLAASWATSRGVDQQRIFLFGVVIISLLGVNGFYVASRLHSARSNSPTSELIGQLQQMRADAPLSLVWQANAVAAIPNPVKRCTAQPFVYPAVSERAWLDAIPAAKCDFYGYGYAQYGITAKNKQVTVVPRLLPNMVKQIVP